MSAYSVFVCGTALEFKEFTRIVEAESSTEAWDKVEQDLIQQGQNASYVVVHAEAWEDLYDPHYDIYNDIAF